MQYQLNKKKQPAKKEKQRMGPSETRVQINCIKWFRMQYARLVYLLFHIPNGGYREAKEAAIFKAMGVVSGVADLFLAIPSGPYHGLFIECKKPGQSQFENQLNFQKWVTLMGYQYVIVDDVEQFIDEVSIYLLPSQYYKPTWRHDKIIEMAKERSTKG